MNRIESSSESQFTKSKLAPLFEAVRITLLQNRLELNQADKINGNHGDHMVEVFQIATQSAQEKQDEDLAEAMLFTASALRRIDP